MSGKAEKKSGSGEHPAVRNLRPLLAMVRENVSEAISESERRLNEELEAYVNDIDLADARRAFPSKF